jgi:TP901-1 family phage major tail protein
MTAQKGKDLLLKVHDGTAFVTVAGLRATRLSVSNETVDITNAESVGRWRELLAGAGVRRVSISGRGLFRDVAADLTLRQYAFDGTIATVQIIIPSFGVVEGAFQVTGLDYAGEHDGEVTYDISLESAGALTFTAI